VGNENWGCGGNMTPEHYANEFRRYSTYCRNYDENKKLYKIVCGPNVDDYNWTRGVMQTVAPLLKFGTDVVHGISLHYYTHPGGWDNKGKALEFTEDEYYETIKRTYYMDELIRRHSDIIDQYDPDKLMGLIVDEWGTWYQVEEGTNPGFLYQQNTMRDAIVAGVNLNIFNENSDRVIMANIAQLVNVLQSLILTEGEKMVLTPTYHVFDMYKDHMDATLLGSYIENEEIGPDDWRINKLSQSASMAADGSVTVTVVNASLDSSEDIELLPVEFPVSKVEATILTDDVYAHNDFKNLDKVASKPFEGVSVEGGRVKFNAPAVSVITLKLS
ncbi:MAG: alpha-N-arabinofuranosidase, partial [Lachnospiraceae bacterium]|nr:alpha-N-arabinofuranosidase [Lachnospiraceae bacterium]